MQIIKPFLFHFFVKRLQFFMKQSSMLFFGINSFLLKLFFSAKTFCLIKNPSFMSNNTFQFFIDAVY